MKNSLVSQRGYLAVLAVLLIAVIGFLGTTIVNMYTSSAQSTVAYHKGGQAFYIAEGGLEIGAHLLELPSLTGTSSRLTCGSITGNARTTNIPISTGVTTITTTSSPIYAIGSLSSALTTSSTTINAVSTAGFAPRGKLMIDHEIMDYAAISGNAFIGVTRAASNTIASSHASGAGIGQYICSLEARGGIPNLSSPVAQAQLQWNVQLDEAWAAGANISASVWNLVRWNTPTEMQWTQQTPSFTNAKQLNGVSVLSNADVWAVGNDASALHFNGSTWSNINNGFGGGDDLMCVSAISSTEAWAGIAQGKIFKWTGGTSWAQSYSPGGASINGISMIDANGTGTASAGWAVANNNLAYFYNGSSWSTINSGIPKGNLTAVSTLAANDAWIVGEKGGIFNWNGSAWLTSASGTTQNLSGISMMKWGASDIGWAVGAGSTALYYNGTSWSLRVTGLAGGLALNDVVILSPDQAWTVAGNGAIYQWNGSTWTLTFTSSKALMAIDVANVSTQPTSTWYQVFN